LSTCRWVSFDVGIRSFAGLAFSDVNRSPHYVSCCDLTARSTVQFSKLTVHGTASYPSFQLGSDKWVSNATSAAAMRSGGEIVRSKILLSLLFSKHCTYNLASHTPILIWHVFKQPTQATRNLYARDGIRVRRHVRLRAAKQKHLIF
jgi:hypothetical protein